MVSSDNQQVDLLIVTESFNQWIAALMNNKLLESVSMEPITLCGAVILAVGLWVEFESIIMKVARAISNSNIMTAIMSSPPEQRPLYVKYMTDIGR